MKNILISAKDLSIGGIEKSLITLINYLIENGYNVTLVLEEKNGELLKNINSNIQIIEYKPSSNKIGFIRKLINFTKRVKFIIKYKNKFDVSISYATYSRMGSFVARVASRNSILWCHANYLDLFKGNKLEVQNFFEEIYFDEFKKIVFVSQSALKSFLKVYPKQKNVYYCNNLIDYNKIYEQAREDIRIKYNQEVRTFLNVGRHDEKQKKLSRIIKVAYLLKKEKYKFRIFFVGSGKDTQKYKAMVKKYKLSDIIFFEGEIINPYPYYKIADCVLLSSDYEGYPVVFLESYLLNVPIITTDVSGYEDIIYKRGLVASKNVKSFYKAMKQFLDKGYIIKQRFNGRDYNIEIEKKLKEILKNS